MTLRIKKVLAGMYELRDYTYGCGSKITIEKSFDGDGWIADGTSFATLREAKAYLNELASNGDFIR